MATQKQRSEETRLKLLSAFRRSFLERGYAATTMRHVLDQTGLSKGALYHHFGSKEEIIEALFEHESRTTIERVMSQTDPTASPLEQLRAACLEWTKAVRDPDVSKIIFEIGPAALGARKAKAIEDRFSLSRIEALLNRAAETGEAEIADPKLIAAFLNALVAEAGLYTLRTGKDASATLATAIDALLENMRQAH